MDKYKIVWYTDKDTAIGSRLLKQSEIGKEETNGVARFEIDQSDFPADAAYIMIYGVEGTPDPTLFDFSKSLDYL